MIIETFFGHFAIPGRPLDGPVLLSRSMPVSAEFAQDFEVTPIAPGTGRQAPKFKRASHARARGLGQSQLDGVVDDGRQVR